MTDCSHIHANFRHVAGLNDEERIRFLEAPRWIGYASAKTVLDTLQSLMLMPKRPRMQNLLIVGDSNNGKTTIVRRFDDLCGQGYVDENAEPVKPVILAESPPSADEKGLLVSILERFYTPYRASDSKTKLRIQAIHMLRACKTRLLIIDEFHSLLTGPARQRLEVMNMIKSLGNELSIPIVGVGTREAVRVILTDPQHASRFDVLSLPKWELNKKFQYLLSDFEAIMPLRKASGLHKPELALPLHAIADGNIGNLHKLLIECAREAITSGQECIDKAIIEKNAWVRPTRGIRERIA